MRKIRWGIIGLGKIARIFAEDLQRVDEVALYAVASRSSEKSVAFAKEFEAELAYASYEELIQDENVEVVYIATPHPFHYDLAMQCVKAKKHVLCEKPMCLHLHQTRSLIAEASFQKVFLMEAIWTRFMPSTLKVLDLIKNNAIGELLSIEADFGFKAAWNTESRLFNKNLGGGALLDIGIYPLFLSRLCMGIPEKIQSSARITATGVDSYCSMLLDFPSGKRATLQSTFEYNTPCEATLFGTKGSIKMHRRFHQSEKVSLLDENRHIVEMYELPYKGNGYVHEIEEVNACVFENKLQSELLNWQFSLDLAEIMETVKKQIGLQYE